TPRHAGRHPFSLQYSTQTSQPLLRCTVNYLPCSKNRRIAFFLYFYNHSQSGHLSTSLVTD
ncbi:hypothetical protein J6590_098737, partial [Homalodisca vitripennis]